MPMTRNEILAEARQLSDDDRETLIEDLRQCGDVELSEDQLAELRRRMATIRSGEILPIPADEAIRQVLAALRHR